MRKHLFGVLLAAAFTATAAHAGLTNGGFEDGGGSLTPWISDDGTLLNTVVTGPASLVPSPDPTHFARLEAGGKGAGVYTTLSQIVTLAIGDTLAGDAFFDSKDIIFTSNPCCNDDAYVKWGSVGLFARNVAQGDSSGWTHFSLVIDAASAGTHAIEAGVRNMGCFFGVPPEVNQCTPDNTFNSLLYVDAFTVTPRDNGGGQVPEPGSMALFATGLLAFGLARRQKGA